MKNESLINLFGCFGIVAFSLLIAICMPLAYALGGFFTGWMLSNVFQFAGNWIVIGAKSLGVELTLSSLPFLGAFLAFVGAFFKSHQSNTNKSK